MLSYCNFFLANNVQLLIFFNLGLYRQLKQGSFRIEKMGGKIDEKLLRQSETNRVDEEVNLKDKVWTENKKMWIIAGPAIFTRFSTFGINLVSQAFVGHIGSTQLAGYSLVVTVLLRFTNGILVYNCHCFNS